MIYSPVVDKSDVLQCRNWRNGTCPKSDPIVLEEGPEHVQLGCRTCRSGWIVTLPVGKAKARYENRISAIKEIERRRRQLEQQPIYFT